MTYASSPIELLTPAEMAEADRLTIAGGTSGFALMTAAGEAVARAAMAMAPTGRIQILAGPGNNGGDGFVAAAALLKAGRDVRVCGVGSRGSLRGDAAHAAALYNGPVEALATIELEGAALAIDALFGAGLARPLSGDISAVVEAVNKSGVPVLAVDLPSGIDGRTGEAHGAAVRAARTVSFFRLKPGHLLLPGRAHCGDIDLVQIGIPDTVLPAIGPRHFRNAPALWRAMLRASTPEDHKYSRGHVFVVSGPAASTGAARLAAAGALRIGAGAATVASPPDALLVNAAHLTAIMLRRFEDPKALSELLSLGRPAAMVIGPGNGVGAATQANVAAALATEAAIVLDADALTSCRDNASALFETIASRSPPVVMTPHEGEFARLFDVTGPRLDRASAAAKASAAVVVLKGFDTIVAAPDGCVAINANATPDLATAGSGDVLAGMIAGLLAQQVPPFEAASAAVWMHAEAGRALGPGLISEDLPNALPAVLSLLGQYGGRAAMRDP